jgi:hypothetical protein
MIRVGAGGAGSDEGRDGEPGGTTSILTATNA